MFTGIIEEIGTITDVSPAGAAIRLRVFASSSALELKGSDSVAINGVCLTVVAKNVDEFEVEAVEETLKKTTLNSMTVGDHCNLELPIRFHERMGGHFVLGHVDVVGHIRHIEERAGSWVMTVEVPELFEKYLIPVGSIAIDGVSFTLAEVR
ncbi:MAG TPA: riboflavin synthase, partial [Bacteroidota bacterium]|nr:riboflavin synthase [Bacteroidota bacterium]